MILDVRSPGEFFQGHLPGAINYPILDNQERAQVGTAYKQRGRHQAVELGFRLIGHKIATYISEIRALLDAAGASQAKVHCWRGGLRSTTMAWFLQTAGLSACTLKGGYKAYRRKILEALELTATAQWRVLGGLTGAGKTEILHALRERGEQVVDLEGMASHKGSSFGMLGMPPQPTVEQFENLLGAEMLRLDLSRPIWIEDESRLIGSCKVPDSCFLQMRRCPLYLIERPIEERLDKLCDDYGRADRAAFIAAVQRIQKRLGGAQTKEIISLVNDGAMRSAIEKILHYYDGTYRYSLISRTGAIQKIQAEKLNAEQWVDRLLNPSLDPSKNIVHEGEGHLDHD